MATRKKSTKKKTTKKKSTKKKTTRAKVGSSCSIPATVKVASGVLSKSKTKETSEAKLKVMAAGIRLAGGSASVRKNPCGRGHLLYFKKTA